MTWVRPRWSRHGEGDGAEHGNEDEACLCGRGTLGEELLEAAELRNTKAQQAEDERERTVPGGEQHVQVLESERTWSLQKIPSG